MCVCSLLHMCVCSQLCQFTVKSVQPPPPPTAVSLSSSSPSLSPMNRLNFLMSCFYGLLMLIHNSPYALSLHPPVSCCLPRLIHPPPAASSPNHTLISLIFLPQQCLLYIYRHRNTCMHTLSQSPICCTDVCTRNFPADLYMPNLLASGKIFEIGKKMCLIMKNIPVRTLKITR